MLSRVAREREFELTRIGGGGAASDVRGFGFVETMIAFVLLSFAVLGVSQMMVTGIYTSEASADLTSITALAAQQLETLRATDYDALVPGGSLDQNVEGYYQGLDLDPAAGAEVTRRWMITDAAGALQIDVRVIGPPNASGRNRDVRLTVIVADR